jgi:hypothetical protein
MRKQLTGKHADLCDIRAYLGQMNLKAFLAKKTLLLSDKQLNRADAPGRISDHQTCRRLRLCRRRAIGAEGCDSDNGEQQDQS